MIAADLANFISSLEQLSRGTRNTARQVLKYFFHRHLKFSKTDLDHPKLENERIIARLPNLPTPEELQQLIESAGATPQNGPRNRALVALLVHGGMRVGAVCEFPIGSYNEQDGPAFMAVGDIQREDVCFVVRVQKIKTRQPRKVYITDNTAMAYIQRWLELHPTKDPNDPLFCTQQDGQILPLAYNTVLWIIKQATKRAGLKKHIHPHLLRKARATRMADEGYDKRDIEHQLGWVLISAIFTIPSW